MYFLCRDKKIIEPNIQFTNAYQYKEYADKILIQETRTYKYLWENEPSAVKTIEGFYLVPERLFDEILKDHVKED